MSWSRRSSAPSSCPATMSRSRWTSPHPNSAAMGDINSRWSSRSSTRMPCANGSCAGSTYPIVSIEDPLAEDDETGLIAFTRAVGDKVQIVGDDYLVTNADRVKHAASVGACNCLLVKPNQAGTVTETRAALDAAKQAGYGRSCLHVRAKRKTSRSCTSRSVGMPASSRSARSPAASGWRSGTRHCGLNRDQACPLPVAQLCVGHEQVDAGAAYTLGRRRFPRWPHLRRRDAWARSH